MKRVTLLVAMGLVELAISSSCLDVAPGLRFNWLHLFDLENDG